MRTVLAAASLVVLGAVTSAEGRSADRFRYVSPRPGAALVNPQTTIILASGPPPGGGVRFPSISVRGSVSGSHPGEWVAAERGTTMIFRPFTPFHPGETVSVLVPGHDGDDFSFRFTVSPKLSDPDWIGTMRCDGDPLAAAAASPPARNGSAPTAGSALPLPLGFPALTVAVNDDPSPGYVFLGPRLAQAAPPYFAIMLDDTGAPAFFRDVPSVAADFKKHPHANLYSYLLGGTAGDFHVFDDTFTPVDTFRQENGYTILDGHDFQILPTGNVLIAVQDWQRIDMSQIVPGGNPNAWVVGLVIQEQDPSHNVVFEWRSWDHFQITDALGLDFTGPWIDYVHFNAFEPDTDGNIMFSCREMCEITKIDRQTGDIIWRFGGLNNEFSLVGDTLWFERQHSVRRTPTGTVTIFDNGALAAPWQSRVVEYSLDEANKIATKVWQYQLTPPQFSGWGSNAQRLSNGNTVIDWTPLGLVTEVRSDGTVVWEAQMSQHWSYRAFRFEWNGVAARPELWHEATWSRLTLHFAKFGDPDVALFHIYRGAAPNPTTRVGSTTANSFVIDAAWPQAFYVRVTAEDSTGGESPYSNERFIAMPPPVGAPVSNREPSLELYPGRPNPFAPRTTIPFALSERGAVELSIFDVRGRLVRTLVRGVRERGMNTVTWDGTDAHGLPTVSGIYFCRLTAGSREATMTIARLR